MNKKEKEKEVNIGVKEPVRTELQHRKADWKSKSYSDVIKRMLEETREDE